MTEQNWDELSDIINHGFYNPSYGIVSYLKQYSFNIQNLYEDEESMKRIVFFYKKTTMGIVVQVLPLKSYKLFNTNRAFISLSEHLQQVLNSRKRKVKFGKI